MARKILAFEDDADFSKLLCLTLERDHFQIRTVMDGRSVLDLAVLAQELTLRADYQPQLSFQGDL